MSRIDELQKAYPSFPREVLIKLEGLRYGIRDSEVLHKVGSWARSGALGTYESYDHDATLKDRAEKGDMARPGYIRRIHSFHMKNGLGVRISRDSTSPYQIREAKPGRYVLYEGEEEVEQVYFPSQPWPYEEREEPVTSKGTLITSLIGMRSPNCFVVVPVRSCEYFATGEQCKFCNWNATQEDARSVGLDRAVTVNLEEIVEAYKILCSEVRLVEGIQEMGAIRDSEREASLHIGLMERIVGQASYAVNMHVVTQPMSRKNTQRLKDAGATSLGYQVEVWDARLFAEVCPGKAKNTGHERYKEAYLEAVDIFGTGNVCMTFAAGVSLMPENGHKTWQDSRDSLIEGVTWLIKNGVVPNMQILRLVPGSIYGDDKSNQAKQAPTEHYVDVAAAHHAAMKEYGRYQNLNKFMANCPLDCLDHCYRGELGFLELAGDTAKWIADVLPEDITWLADFIASVAPAPAVDKRVGTDA